MTNVFWELPHLAYILPCTFNKQVSVQYLAPPTEQIFLTYHQCAHKSKVNILHLNGCGPAPKFCPGYQGPTPYSRSHSVVFDINLDFQLFWSMLAYRDQQLFEGNNPGNMKFWTVFHSELLTIWGE